MTLRNKTPARRPAEQRRPRAGVPAQGRVDLRTVALDYRGISNRNIARLEQALTSLKSMPAPFLTATKSNFSFTRCVTSGPPLPVALFRSVGFKSRASNRQRIAIRNRCNSVQTKDWRDV